MYFPTQQKIAHLITAVDCQPMFDGGILINVLGQLKVTSFSFPSMLLLMLLSSMNAHFFNLHTQTDEDPAHGFSQAFVLKPANASWFIAHDVFRLAIHDVAASV